MKLLLDTHTALWWLSDDKRLSEAASNHLGDASNQLLLSAVVIWEVAIKRSLNKLGADDEYLSLLLEGGAQPLAVTIEHAAAVEHLPFHHHDPFDRLLIAQASIEGAAIVTGDETMRAYDVPVVW